MGLKIRTRRLDARDVPFHEIQTHPSVEVLMPDLIRGIMIGVLIALLLDIGIQFLIVEPRLKKLIRREHDLHL